MKKCPNCFAEVPDYTVYCPRCYKKITGPAETAPKPAAAKPAAVPKAAPAAKKCPGCGKEAPDGAAFCPYCGTRLKGTVTGPASTTAAPKAAAPKPAAPKPAAPRPAAPVTPKPTPRPAPQPAPGQDAELENYRRLIRSNLSAAEQARAQGQDKAEKQELEQATTWAVVVWNQSHHALEDKRTLSEVYETVGTQWWYRSSYFAEDAGQKLLDLWKDNTGNEAIAWSWKAQEILGMANTSRYAENAFRMQAIYGSEDADMMLGVMRIRAKLVEDLIIRKDFQPAYEQLKILMDENNRIFAVAQKDAEHHSRTQAQLDRLNQRLVASAAENARLQGLLIERTTGPEDAEEAYRRAYQFACQLAEQFATQNAPAIPPEVVESGESLASLLMQIGMEKRDQKRMKECLEVVDKTMGWLKKDEKALRLALDVEHVRVTLWSVRSAVQSGQGKYEDAILTAERLLMSSKLLYEDKQDFSSAFVLIRSYEAMVNAWRYKVDSIAIFGKKDAIRKLNIVCEEAAAFAAKAHRIYDEPTFAQYRDGFTAASR